MDLRIITSLLIEGYIFLFLLAALGWTILFWSNKIIYKGQRKINFRPGACLITGLISFVTFYAVIKAKGNSVFILNFLISFFLFLLSRKAKQNENQLSLDEKQNRGIKNFVLRVTVFYLLLIVFVLSHIPAFEGVDWVAFPPSDNLWYIDITEGLKRVGSENLQGQFVFFNHSEKLREPYHYFELWLTAGFSELTGSSSFYSFLIIPIVVLGVTTMIVLSDMFMLFSANKAWIWLFPLAVFFGPLKIGDFLQGVDMYHNLPFPVPKYQVFQLFLLFFIYLFLTAPNLAIIFILFLPVASFTALAPVGGGLFCLVALNFWKHRRVIKMFKELLPVCISLICILLFYIINQQISTKENGIVKGISLNDFGGGLKTRINIIIVPPVFLTLFFSPFILFIFISARTVGIGFKKLMDSATTRLLLFTGAGCLAGLCCWLLLYHLLDSSQLFQNFAITSISGFLTFFLLKVISRIRFALNRKNLLTVSFFLIMVFICIFSTFNQNIYSHPLTAAQKISKTFLQSANELIKPKSSVTLIATANPPAVYINKFNRNEKVYTSCFFLKKEDPSIVGISITGDQALRMKNEHVWDGSFEVLVKASPFVKYLNASGVNIYDSTLIDAYRYEFIKKHKIMYLITRKGYRIPANLQHQLTADSLTDKYSSLSIYKLTL